MVAALALLSWIRVLLSLTASKRAARQKAASFTSPRPTVTTPLPRALVLEKRAIERIKVRQDKASQGAAAVAAATVDAASTDAPATAPTASTALENDAAAPPSASVFVLLYK